MSQAHKCEKPVWSMSHDEHDNEGVAIYHTKLCFCCGGIEKEAVASGEITFIPEAS